MSSLNVWSLPAARPALSYSTAHGRVLLVTGGRQGVGVSTIAALLALVAEGEVLVVEAGAHGVSHRLFGAPRSDSTGGGIDSHEHLPTQVLTSLAVLSLGTSEPRMIARRIAQLRNGFALTVIDAGSRLNVAREVAAGGIDHLLCVTTSDAIATAGAYAMLKAIGGQTQGLRAGVLVNRSPLWAATEVDHYLRQAASKFLRREIDLISHIPLDECLRAGIRAGMPLQEVAVGSPAALALHEVSQSIQLKQFQFSPTVIAPRPLQRRS